MGTNNALSKDDLLKKLGEIGFFVDILTLDSFLKKFEIEAIFEDDNGNEYFDLSVFDTIVGKICNRPPIPKQQEIKIDEETDKMVAQIEENSTILDEETTEKEELDNIKWQSWSDVSFDLKGEEKAQEGTVNIKSESSSSVNADEIDDDEWILSEDSETIKIKTEEPDSELNIRPETKEDDDETETKEETLSADIKMQETPAEEEVEETAQEKSEEETKTEEAAEDITLEDISENNTFSTPDTQKTDEANSEKTELQPEAEATPEEQKEENTAIGENIEESTSEQEENSEDFDDIGLLSDSIQAQEKFQNYLLEELKKKNTDLAPKIENAFKLDISEKTINMFARTISKKIVKQVSASLNNQHSDNAKLAAVQKENKELSEKVKQLEDQNKKLKLLLVETNKNLNSYKPAIFGLYKFVKQKPNKKEK